MIHTLKFQLLAWSIAVLLLWAPSSRANDHTTYYSVTTLEIPIPNLRAFYGAVQEMKTCLADANATQDAGWHVWQQLEGTASTMLVAIPFHTWADYLKDDEYSEACGFSFMETIFSHVNHAERYFFRRLEELSSPQVPAGFMEAYTFWPADMAAFRAVIQEIAGHLEPGDFSNTWSWMAPLGGPNENSMTLLSFWADPAAYDAHTDVWTVLRDKVGMEKMRDLNQRFGEQITRWESYRYQYSNELSFWPTEQ